jgi:Xaa-Pro aminopeptidase
VELALKPTLLPDFGHAVEQPEVPASVFAARCDAAYERAGRDWLAVYADREHFGNIIFLSGFEPRFEEAFLLLGPNRRRVVITGNESESYAATARLPDLKVLRAQTLSLMAQDRSQQPRLADQLSAAGIRRGDSVGLVGWKYLEPEEIEHSSGAYFLPTAYVRMFEQVAGERLSDATPVLLHPETGLRSIVDVDQIAAFEWASDRASRAVWRVVTQAKANDTEFDAISRMGYAGEPLSAHIMFASANARESLIGLRSPTQRRLSIGDCVTTAVGYWGGLSSRAGILAQPDDDFLPVAKTYFSGLLAWYDAVDIDVAGGDIHAAVVDALARGGLQSALNPGHLTGHEEWSHSPIRPGSNEKLRSGMPFQVDIIPTPMPAGKALNCEDPVVIAGPELRQALQKKYPGCWDRILRRREFLRAQIGAELKPSILPLSATPLYLPPFWLSPNSVMARI